MLDGTKLTILQDHIRAALRTQLAEQSTHVLSERVRDDSGDTIFAIDVTAEEILLPLCEEWGRHSCFTLVAEGLEPDTGIVFGQPGASGPSQRLIVDPIDGTRGLMYDKRSAWSLAAVAPEKGPETTLSDITCAVMTELPTSRQGFTDQLSAVRGEGVRGVRHNLFDSTTRDLPVIPSNRDDFLHGFASIVNFFQGGKELTSRFEEDLLRAERGGWNPDKAEIYTDQYISSGGQLAELALGRDRFVLDIRALVHRAMGIESSLCSRPYDLCTALVAQEAGCVVTEPDGSPLSAPLDVTTNVAFVGYANAAMADRVQPMLNDALHKHGLL